MWCGRRDGSAARWVWRVHAIDSAPGTRERVLRAAGNHDHGRLSAETADLGGWASVQGWFCDCLKWGWAVRHCLAARGWASSDVDGGSACRGGFLRFGMGRSRCRAGRGEVAARLTYPASWFSGRWSSAGDGRGCGRLGHDGERVVAESSQDVGGVRDDPASLRQAGSVRVVGTGFAVGGMHGDVEADEPDRLTRAGEPVGLNAITRSPGATDTPS
jgi:hypothetical protein